MNLNHAQAKQLLSSSEMELFQSSQDPTLARLSPPELKSDLHAARSARDKAQDLLRRQRLDSRDRTGTKGGTEGVDNARTEQKLEALTEILRRFEAQLADIESSASSEAPADDAPVVSVGALTAGVRTALKLKQESVATHATSSAGPQRAVERAAAHGSSHSGTSDSAQVAAEESHLQEVGVKAVQGHTSTQTRRDQAKRDASD